MARRRWPRPWPRPWGCLTGPLVRRSRWSPRDDGGSSASAGEPGAAGAVPAALRPRPGVAQAAPARLPPRGDRVPVGRSHRPHPEVLRRRERVRWRADRIHAKRIRETNPQTVEALAELFVDYNQPHDPLGVLRPGASRSGHVAHRVGGGHRRARTARDRARHLLRELPLRALERPAGAEHAADDRPQPPRLTSQRQPRPPAVGAGPSQRSGALRGDATHRPAAGHHPVPQRSLADLIAERSPVPLPLEPYPVSSTIHPKWSRWQAQFLTHEAGTIDRLLADADAYTSFGDICDLAALRRELPTIGAASAARPRSRSSAPSASPSPCWGGPTLRRRTAEAPLDA